jgi:hypothetical protein
LSTADQLTTALDRTSEVIGRLTGPARTAWLFTRCWLAATRFEDHDGSPADLELALADFAQLPADTPGRAKLAAILVVAMLKRQATKDFDAVDIAGGLAEIADTDPAPLPHWRPARAVVRVRVIQRKAMLGAPGFQLRESLTEVRGLAEEVGDDQPYATIVKLTEIMLRMLIAQQDGSRRAMDEVAAEAAALQASLPPGFPMREQLDKVRQGVEMMRQVLSGNLPSSDGGHTSETLGPLLNLTEQGVFTQEGAPDAAHEVEQNLDRLRVLADAPGLVPAERAIRLNSLASAELASDDPSMIADAIRHVSEAVELVPRDDPRRPMYRFTQGFAMLRRWEVTGERDGLVDAIDAIEEGKAANGWDHNHALLAAMPLAAAYRATGRKQHGRTTAVKGLRSHVWNVLLQSNVRDMHDAARRAAEDAITAAQFCLSDNDAESAARALEAGRCLIIHSALETRDIGSRLRAIGADELAEQWGERSPENAPSDLRRMVVSKLVGIPLDEHGTMKLDPEDNTTQLLDPPSTHEIRAALNALGSDALIYLMAGDDGSTGAAVIVPVDGRTTWIRLPELQTAALRRFRKNIAAANTSRDVRRVTGVVPDICDWAWQAAIGPLLTECLLLPEDRPIRLVLVPMGELARVPWHAARHSVSGRMEYALENAVFSYTPSARLLCKSAWANHIPLTGSGLIIGDPYTGERDLPAARSEALAIRETFYPDARYLGRDATGQQAAQGAGTASEVTAWLADPSSGTFLHAACHSVVTGTDLDRTSYLLLANGEHLSAEDLTGTLDRDLALTVLASCRSAESGKGYDEAFSLSTVFLANKTRSVISTQWSVPDAPTSLLMYLLHHYLNEEKLPPADALRAAQLHMTKDVPLPAGVPRSLTGTEAKDPGSWAAFVHSGR